MDYKFDSWQEALSSFQKDVEKELKEMHRMPCVSTIKVGGITM